MTSRPKQPRVLSPKKVSRRKRTPRCQSCGKAEGAPCIDGDENGPRVRLKLCARCRKVTYCGMACQKLAWTTHREVCVHYACNSAELPAPSPVVIGGTGHRGRRKYPIPSSPTSRKGENSPTKYPFVGKQESMGCQASSCMESSGTAEPNTPAAPQGGNKATAVRDLDQGKDLSLHHPEGTSVIDDGGCPSPPKIERLSMASQARVSRSRDPRFSNGISRARREDAGEEVAKVAASTRAPMSSTQDNNNWVISSWRRWSFSPSGLRANRNTQEVSASRGNASPPSSLGRRGSAPPYSAALKNKSRASGSRVLASSGPASARGPPPPYSLVASRAKFIRRHTSDGTIMSTASTRDSPGAVRIRATAAVREEGVRLAEFRLPPPSSRPLSEIPSPGVSPSSAPPPLQPGITVVSPNVLANGDTGTRGGTSKTRSKDSTPRCSEEVSNGDFSAVACGAPGAGAILAAAALVEEDGSSAQQASVDAAAIPDEGDSSYDSKKKEIDAHEQAESEDTAREVEAGVSREATEVAEGEKAILDNGSVVSTQKESREEEKREKETSLDPKSSATVIAEREETSTETHFHEVLRSVQVAAGAKSPEISLDRPTGAEGDDVSRTVACAGPPPPILPHPDLTSSSTPAKPSTDLNRAPIDGTGSMFDSCPPSAGIPGFAEEIKSCAKEPLQRSFSVDNVPESSPFPFAAKFKEITATALAWTRGRGSRRTPPRPRPPGSPGPAAPSDDPSSEVSSAPREKIAIAKAVCDDGVTAPSSAKSTSGTASPWVRSASCLPSAPTPIRGTTVVGAVCSPSSPPAFVPIVEMSPTAKAPTPHSPGPRVTETAAFYQRRSTAPRTFSLPPPSRAYLGRPAGFSVHVLVAAAPCAADLPTTIPMPEKTRASNGGREDPRRTYYSFADRRRVAQALRPGDVVLLTPGMYEARSWGLQKLISSIEIIGAGDARACVLYNDPAKFLTPHGEHYLVGIMGGGSVGDGSSRIVRVRFANLTLEQGCGHRGAIYQLGHESHLELDGCDVRCSQGGVNVDQGTCLICDTTISGSEVFGVHIGGDGAVEHCAISGCGTGEGRGDEGIGGGDGGSFSRGAKDFDFEDDGTDVNRMAGMPAISVLQRSRARVRFNIIHDNIGHSLQFRDAPLPRGNDKRAILERQVEAEVEKVRGAHYYPGVMQ